MGGGSRLNFESMDVGEWKFVQILFFLEIGGEGGDTDFCGMIRWLSCTLNQPHHSP